MRHLRLGQAQEDRGRFGDFLAGLAHMLAVVQADAEDLARVGYHGQQFELRELQRRLVLAGGFCDGAEKVLGNQGLEVHPFQGVAVVPVALCGFTQLGRPVTVPVA